MRHLILIGILLFTFGCGSVTFKTSAQPEPTMAYDEYFNFWVLVFGSAQVSIDQACPGNRFALIRNYMSVEDVLISWISSGIYTPRTSKIICAAGTVHAAN